MITHHLRLAACGLALAVASLPLGASAQAQDVASFYRGKAVQAVVGYPAGSTFELYLRMFARHVGKHIPGNPTVVVANVPGAGGNILANNLYTIAPKDGTYMGVTFPSVMIDPLLSVNHRGYDPTKFNYIGNANSEVLVCLLRRDTGVKSLEDFMKADLIIGATAPGSTTADYPAITKGLLGAKFRLVTGYKGSREVTLAVEKNEVQGICGLGWSTVKVQYPQILKEDMFAQVFMQEDL